MGTCPVGSDLLASVGIRILSVLLTPTAYHPFREMVLSRLSEAAQLLSLSPSTAFPSDSPAWDPTLQANTYLTFYSHS